MTNGNLWISPLTLFIIFLVVSGLYMLLGQKIAAKSRQNEDKHTHYSCGEDLEVTHLELNYHAFFRLALLFGILHIVALIISTVPPTGRRVNTFPIVYLAGAAISMFILLEHDE